MTQARFELDPYTIRVLDVVKGKFGLKTRNAALKKFVECHGEQYAEVNVDERVLHELDKSVTEHNKKHKKRRMSTQELDTHLGL